MHLAAVDFAIHPRPREAQPSMSWFSSKVTLMLSLLLLLGGCSVPWKIVKESGPPSALTGAGAVAIQFDYSALLVEGMSQEAWVAQQKAKEPEYEKSWTDLKARLEEYYVQGFQDGWGTATRLAPGAAKPEGTILVLVKVNTLDMGHYIPFATSRSQVTVNVVWDANGPEDEIMVTGTDTPTLINASIFQHVGHIGQYLGKVSAKYLSTKQ
jgi:hypothetical protein